ncbi:MAG: topoisomerase DNA-binding C4 zinc finger domain-containing protein [Culicoidibacterales bacterium]
MTKYHGKNRKYQFQNPLHQNYGHMKQLAALLERDEADFIQLVVFNNGAKLKLDDETQISRRAQISDTIQSYEEIKLSARECQQLAQQVRTANIQSLRNKRKHVQQIKQNITKMQNLVDENVCPTCASELVERKGKYSNFLGCSSFPKCRYTAKMPVTK